MLGWKVCLAFGSRKDWGHSSVGRAVALQASGRRFDPVWLHHSSNSVVFRHLAVETSLTSFAALQRAGVLLIDIVNEGICLLAYAVRIER